MKGRLAKSLTTKLAELLGEEQDARYSYNR